MWVYQKGHIRPRTDLQPQGLSQDDLVRVKLNVGNWDPPDRPLELPSPADYDAAAVLADQPWNRPPATRATAVCEACTQTRLKRKVTKPHSLVWGECLQAVRPQPPAAADLGEEDDFLHQPRHEDVDPEHQLRAAACAVPDDIRSCPHAALALVKAASSAATWGSVSSAGDSTAAPEDDASDFGDALSTFSDTDELVVGAGSPGLEKPTENSRNV